VSIRTLFRLGVLATLADVVTTFVALRLYAGLYEGNPLARQVIDAVGLEGMLVLRGAIGVGVCWVAVHALTGWRSRTALLFAAGFWGLVALSNVYEIGRVASA
jgi:hypothetical protein